MGVLTGGGNDDTEPPPTPPVEIGRVAQRVERVRGLRFDEVPPLRLVTQDEAREEGLGDLDARYPEPRRRADGEVLMLLGLLPPDSDLRDIAGSIYGEQVSGYYDERREEMALVPDSYRRNRVEGELTLAHELTHALEDQHFGLGPEPDRVDDAGTAYLALVEGTATVAMLDYALRHQGGGAGSREAALGALGLAELVTTPGMPPYMQHSLGFSYVAGARFVHAIGTWGPANRALRSRPPASTEQVLHPRKYREREAPLRVPAGTGPGSGWTRAAAGTIGEFDTAELIRTSDALPRARAAGAGWGGGRYELWQRPEAADCSRPCRKADALVLAWRMDTPRDAAELAAALPRYVERTLGGRRRAGAWAVRGGAVAIGLGSVVRLAMAPDAALAQRLARAL